MVVGAGPHRLQPAFAKATAGAATSPAEAGEETEWGALVGAGEEIGGGLAAWWWEEVEAAGAGLWGACDDGFVDCFADWREADQA